MGRSSPSPHSLLQNCRGPGLPPAVKQSMGKTSASCHLVLRCCLPAAQWEKVCAIQAMAPTPGSNPAMGFPLPTLNYGLARVISRGETFSLEQPPWAGTPSLSSPQE